MRNQEKARKYKKKPILQDFPEDKKRMRLRGIEPPHAAPEATALSTELQTHLNHDTIFLRDLQGVFCCFFIIILL